MTNMICDITSVSYYNHDTRRILLSLPKGAVASFQAGQYLQVKLPSKMCPFSIASAPNQNGSIELHIRPTPDSLESDEIEALLDKGGKVEIEMPLGECILTAPPKAPLLLIAAATGITQMKSILEQILPMEREHPIYLYWGVMSDKDLYLADLCESWQTDYPNFHFVPVVSEPGSSPQWQGKTGLVGQVALADLGDVSQMQIYVGGSPGMVYATLDLYVESGMPTENMFSDVFSYAPRT